jgi:hypothetical protein
MVKTRFIAAKTETPSLEQIRSQLSPAYIQTSNFRRSPISSSSFPKHFPTKKFCMKVLFLHEKYMHETHQLCHLADERRLGSSVLHQNRLAKAFVQCCNIVYYD